MVSLIALALLGGTLLGIRYKVAVLFMVSSVALSIVIANSVVHDSDFWSTVLTAITSLTCLQFAFLVGCTIRSAQEDGLFPGSRVRAGVQAHHRSR